MASKQTKNSDMAALYARYSSDLQSAASIDDQLRMCQERAAKDGRSQRATLMRLFPARA